MPAVAQPEPRTQTILQGREVADQVKQSAVAGNQRVLQLFIRDRCDDVIEPSNGGLPRIQRDPREAPRLLGPCNVIGHVFCVRRVVGSDRWDELSLSRHTYGFSTHDRAKFQRQRELCELRLRQHRNAARVVREPDLRIAALGKDECIRRAGESAAIGPYSGGPPMMSVR